MPFSWVDCMEPLRQKLAVIKVFRIMLPCEGVLDGICDCKGKQMAMEYPEGFHAV